MLPLVTDGPGGAYLSSLWHTLGIHGACMKVAGRNANAESSLS